jgi:hypothetical protein
MITKPLQHEIDDAGERILRNTLEPLRWGVNKVQKDYGIDFNVQVFDRISPNGMWFHIQLKSHQVPNYSSDRAFISEPIEIDHVRHFVNELQQPMFLVVADVGSKKLFWHCLQLDTILMQRLDGASQQDTITVRVPTKQHLPGTEPQFLTALRRSYIVLANRQLTRSSKIKAMCYDCRRSQIYSMEAICPKPVKELRFFSLIRMQASKRSSGQA